MSACIFCKIVAKEIPAEIIYEDELLLAFKDIDPQAPSHFLVITKQHISDHLHLSNQEHIMVKVTKAINTIAKEQGLSKKGFRIVNNVGGNGGQEVKHIHWHVLGGRKMTWPPG